MGAYFLEHNILANQLLFKRDRMKHTAIDNSTTLLIIPFVTIDTGDEFGVVPVVLDVVVVVVAVVSEVAVVVVISC
jgi:hypothetical protein